MKTALHILAVLVLLAAGFFGYQLKTKYEVQLADTATLVTQNANISKAIDGKKEDKGDSEKSRKESLATRDATTADLELSVAKSGELKSTLAKIDVRMEEAQAELDTLNKLKEELEKTVPGITIAELPAEIERLKTEKITKEKRLEELDLVNTKISEDIAKKQTSLTREKGLLSDSRERVRKNKFEAPITAVNSEWGYVIIGGGESSGLTGSSKLLVKRGGRLIGKLTISSLESNQAIAEIVPDSVSIGVRLMAGDRVILQDTVSN